MDTKKFNCGHSALDDYIRRYGSQDLKRDLSRVFVVTLEDDIDHLAGFSGQVSAV